MRKFTASPGELLLAGLPHLLFGCLQLVIMFVTSDGVLGFGTGEDLAYTAAIIGMALILIGVLVTAGYLGWPVWSASWYGYGMALAYTVVMLAIQSIGLPGKAGWIEEAISFVLVPLALVYLMFRLMRADRTRGLLFTLPVLAGFWMICAGLSLPYVDPSLAAGTWLVTALAAMLILGWSDLRSGLLIALILNGLVGWIWSPILLPVGFAMDAFHSFSVWLAAFLVSSTLVLGPLLAWRIEEQGYDSGRDAWLGTQLALQGMLLAFAAGLSFIFLAVTGQLEEIGSGALGLFRIVIILEGLLYLAGWIVLLRAIRHTWVYPGPLLTALLFVLPAAIPALLLAAPFLSPVMDGANSSQAEIMFMIGGLIWLLGSVYLIFHLSPNRFDLA